jgi:5-oxoprolinase (ATP-hydrolysing)
VSRGENIGAGTRIGGPALIIEKISTVMVESGWEAEMASRGHLPLTRVEEPAPAPRSG